MTKFDLFLHLFSATKSKYAHLMDEYVTAQKVGEGEISPGECYPYYKDCSKSIFKNAKEQNKYRYLQFIYFLIKALKKSNIYHHLFSANAEQDHNSDLPEDNTDIDNVIQLNGIENEFRETKLNSNFLERNSFSVRS